MSAYSGNYNRITNCTSPMKLLNMYKSYIAKNLERKFNMLFQIPHICREVYVLQESRLYVINPLAEFTITRFLVNPWIMIQE
jgi:hypothetical protein